MLGMEYSQEFEQKWHIAPQFASHPIGKNITIRRAKVSDAQRIQEMHHRLSRESVFYRYLRPYKPTIEDLEEVCSLGDDEGFVVIATIDGPKEKVVGICYYCVEPQNPASAEPAVLVEDAYQGCGLGKQLLMELSQNAKRMGVNEFTCYTHPGNLRVLGMIERSGMPFENRYQQGIQEIRVRLNSIPLQ